MGNNRIALLPAPLWVCCSLGLKDVRAALSAVLREVVNNILKPKQWFGGELARDARTACLTGAGLLGWTSNLQTGHRKTEYKLDFPSEIQQGRLDVHAPSFSKRILGHGSSKGLK